MHTTTKEDAAAHFDRKRAHAHYALKAWGKLAATNPAAAVRGAANAAQCVMDVEVYQQVADALHGDAATIESVAGYALGRVMVFAQSASNHSTELAAWAEVHAALTGASLDAIEQRSDAAV